MSPSSPASCAVLELRQYTLRHGQRDTLIDLFEREFIEPQEASGMTVFAQFRDLDDPDRFTWLRGFTDMHARAEALAAFYGGPVWQAHRDAANATMLDSDDVLLLRPARCGSGFRAGARADGKAPDGGLVVATMHHFDAPVDDACIRHFEDAIAPLAMDAGTRILATFATEPAANNFPRLPVREGEHVLAWFAHFDDATAHARHAATLAASPAWRQASATWQRLRRTETLRLAPTARSRGLHAHGETLG